MALLTLLIVAWTAVWAVVTPAFRSPDEQNHVNSVLRLAYGGGWPAPGEARFAPVIERAVDEAAYPADVPGRYTYREDVRQLVDVVPVPREDRARITPATALPPAGSDAEIDQMTQHPPAYYALGAGLLRVTGLADARWDQAMLALRLLDAALFAASIPFAGAAALRLTGSRSAALLAAPLPLLVPQVGHVMGSVNNDALVVLVCAVVTYLCARVVTGDLRWRVAVGIGVVLGIGLLTKVMVAFAVPTVLAAYLLASRAAWSTWSTRISRVAASMLVALVVGGWWWVRNVLTLGAVQPSGRLRDVSGFAQVPDDEALSLSIGRVAQSFFGQLGWLEVRLDGDWVVLGSTVLAAAALVALVLPGARRATAVLVLLPLGLAAGVVYNALDFHAETGVLVALQGRYVFGGLAALAVVVAVAVWQVLGRSERRTAVAVPVAAAVAMLAAGAGLWWGFTTMYQGPGEDVGQALDRWLAWSPLTGSQLVVVLGAAALAALAAAVAAVRWSVLVRTEENAA
jgi:4-amino-4-deoxy-L-arabinose transferase-like glycosyltransferase